ncbi:thiol-activated cytolysin family protein [Luteirhabdus pelagi]|uniref:thiol-activated cytolysin family protein n=1 Tax=Luteirhabdus pelagi TaxID=2792783 RepID=UPI00193A43B1|nr:thiol-activated cytolysin family protein [Luteirhabdus pelagi]
MLSLLVIVLCLQSCSKDEQESSTNPEAGDIDAYLRGLAYDPNEMLNVQDTGGSSSQRTLLETSESTSNPDQGTVFDCQIEDYSLASNYEDVAILRPTNDVIFPGALVAGDQNMLDGSPNLITLDRSPMTLTIDLPGMGDQGVLNIENPQNSSVQPSIDNALQWWNDNAYEEGYVNAANSTYQSATSYSSVQLGMDIGLNAQWATGSFASQLQFESSTESRVASIAFKQVFYTVKMDAPSTPSAVFGPNVSLDDVTTVLNNSTPPAYVSSVNYGRIIMIRMETSNVNYDIDVAAVLDYATGVNSGSGDINVSYESVLNNSSLSVITIGGNAEVAVSAIETANIEEGPGSISHIITGENAVYSRDNPGVPIGYTIRYLKDHSLAKMGYTTEYTVEECGNFGFVHDEITVENNSFHDTRFHFKYKGQNSDIVYNGQSYYLNQDDRVSHRPPNGAHDVSIIFESQIGAGEYEFVKEIDYNYIYYERCYEFYGGTIFDQAEVQQISCD